MWHFEHENKELEEIERQEKEILYLLQHKLSTIKIRFKFKEKNMANTDPVTISVGQVIVATIVGFDQNGQPFLGTIPTPTWAIDNSALATIATDATNAADEDITGVAPGVSNLSASLVNAQGTTLTDSEPVTVVVPQVLTSIQIQFLTSLAQAAAKTAVKKA
jgi:hypothetical protein